MSGRRWKVVEDYRPMTARELSDLDPGQSVRVQVAPNLSLRFQYIGDGMWALRSRGVIRTTEIAGLPVARMESRRTRSGQGIDPP